MAYLLPDSNKNENGSLIIRDAFFLSRDVPPHNIACASPFVFIQKYMSDVVLGMPVVGLPHAKHIMCILMKMLFYAPIIIWSHMNILLLRYSPRKRLLQSKYSSLRVSSIPERGPDTASY